MKLGICTTDFPTLPVGQLFERIAEMGFSGVQLCYASVTECGFTADARFDIPAEIPDAAQEAIAEAAERCGLTICAVNGTYNMAHPDAAVRAEGLARFDGLCDAAAALGIGVVSLCSGTRSLRSMWQPHPDNGSESAWRDLSASLRGAAAIAEKYGLTLAIETEASNIIDTPAKARRMLDEIGSPALKMVLDAANLFLPGTAHPQNVRPVLTEAFAAFGRDVVLAHGKDIAESDGIAFVPTGEGILDFPFFLQLLEKYGYNGDFVLHGIFDESKMKQARARIAALLTQR